MCSSGQNCACAPQWLGCTAHAQFTKGLGRSGDVHSSNWAEHAQFALALGLGRAGLLPSVQGLVPACLVPACQGATDWHWILDKRLRTPDLAGVDPRRFIRAMRSWKEAKHPSSLTPRNFFPAPQNTAESLRTSWNSLSGPRSLSFPSQSRLQHNLDSRETHWLLLCVHTAEPNLFL